MRIQYACICHRGLVRSKNQDNLAWEKKCLPPVHDGMTEPALGEQTPDRNLLFGVFDGLGGEPRGEAAAYIAARMTAESEITGSAESLILLCREINRSVCDYARENALSSCGTTAALLSLGRKRVAGCNLGDSRIYLCRNGILTQLSEDHVLPAFHRSKPPLLQYLGIPETEMKLEPTVFEKKPCRNDLYLICSDGLTDMLSDRRILDTLEEYSAVKEKAAALLARSLEKGGRDNISFILIGIRPPMP